MGGSGGGREICKYTLAFCLLWCGLFFGWWWWCLGFGILVEAFSVNVNENLGFGFINRL